MRTLWLRHVLLALVTMGVSPLLPAQEQRIASFALTGTVIDTLGTPVPFAQVSVFNRDQGTYADDDGRFRLDPLPLERTRFAVRRIGFDPVYFDIDVPVAATVEVRVRMRQNARVLPTVDISSGLSEPLRREGFYDRMAAGHGLFVTPEMIAAIRPIRATDAFVNIPNVVVHRRGSRTRISSSNVHCEYGLVVDRMRFGQAGSRVRTTSPDDAVSGTDLYAIEVYPRNRGLPAHFLGMTQDDGCGTIVIWTKGMLPR